MKCNAFFASVGCLLDFAIIREKHANTGWIFKEEWHGHQVFKNSKLNCWMCVWNVIGEDPQTRMPVRLSTTYFVAGTRAMLKEMLIQFIEDCGESCTAFAEKYQYVFREVKE